MPRLARLDAPGILHHVMGRGIERKQIFINDTDRSDFLDRLAALAEEGAMDVYAWVLMPNHILCGAPHKTWFPIMQNPKISMKYSVE
jgi:REP element-mobilizing transposase RayT